MPPCGSSSKFDLVSYVSSVWARRRLELMKGGPRRMSTVWAGERRRLNGQGLRGLRREGCCRSRRRCSTGGFCSRCKSSRVAELSRGPFWLSEGREDASFRAGRGCLARL